jgi:hypothetical protein
MERICTCKRKDHLGEAVDQQVADPFNQSVFGPGAEITSDGEVKIDGDFKRKFVEQFDDE